MEPDSTLTLALALAAQDRHACTTSVTCRLCLPATRWPCGAWQTAQVTIEQIAATSHPAAPNHPDWYDGRS